MRHKDLFRTKYNIISSKPTTLFQEIHALPQKSAVPQPHHQRAKGTRGGRHLRLGGIGRRDGAEGGSVKGAVGVQRGHTYCQVSGAKADGRTFKLQLVDQLVHCPQSSDVERNRVRTAARGPGGGWLNDSRAPPTSQRCCSPVA